MISLFDIYTDLAPILRLKVSDTTVPIIVAEQQNPIIPNYITYKLTNWEQLGHAASGYEDDNVNSDVYETESLWTVNLRLVFIGVKSEQLALQFGHQFNKPSYQDSFYELGLSYLHHSGIKPSPRAVADGWEQRHMLDVKFEIIIKDSDELEFFNSVEVTQEIQDAEDNILNTQTFEIEIQ